MTRLPLLATADIGLIEAYVRHLSHVCRRTGISLSVAVNPTGAHVYIEGKVPEVPGAVAVPTSDHMRLDIEHDLSIHWRRS